MGHQMNATAKNILINVIVASVTGAIVFAVTMTAVVKQVNISANEIEHLRAATVSIRTDLAAERQRTDNRIFELAKLMTAQLEQNRELITLIKVQNRIVQ